MTEPSGYLLGSDDEEIVRLESQHRLWSRQAETVWKRAGFGPGQTLLDLGCGPGFTTVDLARIVGPGGRVIGVDASARFLDHLRAQTASRSLENVECIECDAHEVTLPRDGIDGGYARWLFCYLRRPQRVVRRVAAALRREASFAVTDYFNYGAFTFAPRSAALDRVVDAVQKLWKRRGGDLDVQSRMAALMHDAGLEVVEITPVTVIALPGTSFFDWPAAFFRGFMPTLEQSGAITPAQRDAFWRDWEARARDRSAFLFLPPMVDVIARKP